MTKIGKILERLDNDDLTRVSVILSRVYEMSKKKKATKKVINAHLNNILEHIVKILIYNDADRESRISGWEGEIITWLDDIDKTCNNLKTKTGRLSLDGYMKYLDLDFGHQYRLITMIRSMKISLTNGGAKLPFKEVNQETTYKLIYSLMKEQFEIMSSEDLNIVWQPEDFLENSKYIQLKTN